MSFFFKEINNTGQAYIFLFVFSPYGAVCISHPGNDFLFFGMLSISQPQPQPFLNEIPITLSLTPTLVCLVNSCQGTL